MELDCGIKYERIAAWLADELALPRKGEAWSFVSGNAACRVYAEVLEPRTFRSVQFERTALRVEGDQEALDAFMALFTLRFMSAGG